MIPQKYSWAEYRIAKLDIPLFACIKQMNIVVKCNVEVVFLFKNMRKKLGLTQRQMAKKLGITQGTLSKLENNSVYKINIIKIIFIRKVCHIFLICPIILFLYFYDEEFYCPFSSLKNKCKYCKRENCSYRKSGN